MDNSLKDKVLQSVDIVEIVGERVALKRQGKDYIGLCPFHPDHKPSLSVSPRKQIFKCWSCGAGGDVIRFIQLLDRVDFREALATLARRAGLELRSTPADREAAKARDEIQAAIAWARKHFQSNLQSTPTGSRALEYALQRGLTRDTIERHGLGFAPDAWDDLWQAASRAGWRVEILRQAGLVVTSEQGKTYDRFRNRLIFPIADALGRPVAFGGRTLGDDPAKYLNSPETVLFSKSRVLYGFDLARRAIEERGAAVVVEGYMDAVLLHQHGFNNVVATLGTALTDAHAKLLQPRASMVYLCFDGDQAGIKAADRAVEVALRTQADVRVVLLAGGEDPADCVVAGGAERFGTYLNQARDALEFKWLQTLNAFGRAGPQSKRTAIDEYLGFVAGASIAGGIDPLQQVILIGRLSELLGLPAEEVFELLGRAKRAFQRRSDEPGPEATAASTYEQATRGLPAGLVTATETVLGLLLTDAQCWRWVDDTVARATAYFETWKRLYQVLLEVHQEMSEYSIRDLVSRCEDGPLCELVSRVLGRVQGLKSAHDDFAAACQALLSELELLRMGGLREGLRPVGPEDADNDRAFQSLRSISKAQDWVLPADSRRSATAASP